MSLTNQQMLDLLAYDATVAAAHHGGITFDAAFAGDRDSLLRVRAVGEIRSRFRFDRSRRSTSLVFDDAVDAAGVVIVEDGFVGMKPAFRQIAFYRK